jgi:hypothetical protein
VVVDVVVSGGGTAVVAVMRGASASLAPRTAGVDRDGVAIAPAPATVASALHARHSANRERRRDGEDNCDIK